MDSPGEQVQVYKHEFRNAHKTSFVPDQDWPFCTKAWCHAVYWVLFTGVKVSLFLQLYVLLKGDNFTIANMFFSHRKVS